MSDSETISNLSYLQEHRRLSELTLNAITLCLSNPSETKESCMVQLTLWREMLNKLHEARLQSLFGEEQPASGA